LKNCVTVSIILCLFHPVIFQQNRVSKHVNRYAAAHVEKIRLSMTSAEQGSACLTPVDKIRYFLALFMRFHVGLAFCIFTIK
jgi:uncharacterized metal-binding protein